MRRFRSSKQQIKVIDTRFALRPILRRVSINTAVELVSQGKAVELLDPQGELRGIELAEPQSAPSCPPTLERFNPMFSQAEVHAIAGTNFKHGRSRTASLTEAQRAERKDVKTGQRLVAEDLIERSTEKIKCFQGPLNESRPDRSTTVYPSGIVTGQYAKKGA